MLQMTPSRHSVMEHPTCNREFVGSSLTTGCYSCVFTFTDKLSTFFGVTSQALWKCCTCECVMKSMAGRDHVGAFLVHGTCCVCHKVLVSSSKSKYIVISHIVTTIICIYLYFISPIFIYLTYHFIQRNACFNLPCVLLLWCTVLWILIALFICCTCQKWRNKDVQSNLTQCLWRNHGALIFSLICVLNKRLSKQSWDWWFETPSCSLWRHCNGPAPNHSKTNREPCAHVCTLN